MNKKIRNNSNRMLLAVLSIVLILVLGYTATFAWFTANDGSNRTTSLGGAVIVNVADTEGKLTNGKINFNLVMDYLLPGSLLSPNVSALVIESSTASVMRARVRISVVEGDREFSDVTKNMIKTYMEEAFNTHSCDSWGLYTDGWFYFIGKPGQNNVAVMKTTATENTLNNPDYVPQFGTTKALYEEITEIREIEGGNTVVASVDVSKSNVVLPFIDKSFRIPYFFGNEFAGLTIGVEFFIESLQDYLVDPDLQDGDISVNVMPTIYNVKKIMDSLSKYV